MRRSFLLATSWSDSPISYSFRAVARELVARGHEVCVITDGRVDIPDGTDGVPSIATWPSARPTHLADLAFAVRLIGERAVDTVVGNFGSVNVMLAAGRWCRVPRRIAWYHTLSTQIEMDHGAAMADRLLRARKRMIYRSATRLVAVSASAKHDLETRFAVPADRVVVLHPGVPDPLGAPQDRVRRGLVCPGRLHPSKGQDVLIRALPLVPGVTATFLGDGTERPALEALARQLGVHRRCRFEGSVPSSRVHDQLSGAAVAVLPSRAEAFGFTCVEALACGSAVVASDTGGFREIVRDGVEGFLTNPGDSPALAAAIQRALEAGPGMRAAARRRFCDTFDLDLVARSTADWLETL